MLTSVTTVLAAAILLALMFIWGNRYRIEVQRQTKACGDLRLKLERSAAHARQWRQEAQRLRAIVDRVEEGLYGPSGSTS